MSSEQRDSSKVTADAILERPPEETKKYYEKWSTDYDQDVKVARYNGPETFMKYFLPLNMPKTLRVLDIGAGTGALGEKLKEHGYDNIDALDACPAMLAKAKVRNVYQNLIEAMILPTQQLNIPDGSYDLIVAVGVFVPGHIPVEAFREIVRITRKGNSNLIINRLFIKQLFK